MSVEIKALQIQISDSHKHLVTLILQLPPLLLSSFLSHLSVMAPVQLYRERFKMRSVTLTSTAETRTEKRAPVFSFLSLMSLNNQEMAQGIIPRVWRESSRPIIVKDLPARDRQTDGIRKGWTEEDGETLWIKQNVIKKKCFAWVDVCVWVSSSVPLSHNPHFTHTHTHTHTYLHRLSGAGDQTHTACQTLQSHRQEHLHRTRRHQKPDSCDAGWRNVFRFVQRWDGGEVVTYTVILHCSPLSVFLEHPNLLSKRRCISRFVSKPIMKTGETVNVLNKASCILASAKIYTIIILLYMVHWAGFSGIERWGFRLSPTEHPSSQPPQLWLKHNKTSF